MKRSQLKRSRMHATKQYRMKQYRVKLHGPKGCVLQKRGQRQHIMEKARVTPLRKKLRRPRPRFNTIKQRLEKLGKKRHQQKLQPRTLYGQRQYDPVRYDAKQHSHKQREKTREQNRVRQLAHQPDDPKITSKKYNQEMYRLPHCETSLSEITQVYISVPEFFLGLMRTKLSRWEKSGESFPGDRRDFKFPPEKVLSDIGIKATRIDSVADGMIQFNPCFFQPHHEMGLLLEYPIETSQWILPPELPNPIFAHSFHTESWPLSRAEVVSSFVEKHFLALRSNLQSDDIEKETSSLLEHSQWR